MILVYSLTKSFIATIFCRLADRGELSLDDPVGEWLDEPTAPAATLRQLLNHTAGLPDYADGAYAAAVAAHPSEPWDDGRLLAHALARPAPTRWTYSNAGYLLLRRVLDERLGGFAELLRAELTEPLGLADTRLALDLRDLDGLDPGPSTELGPGRRDVRGRYHPCWVGHRTAISTEADLARFWRALAAGELLGASFAELLAFVDVGIEAYGLVRPGYGLGVMGDPDWPYGTLVGHGGGGPGYRAAAFAVLRREPVVAVVLGGEGDEVEAAALAKLEESAA